MLTLGAGCLKLSSKYLKDRICKIKHYLNYKPINQSILAILRTFLNLQKNYENFYIKWTSTAANKLPGNDGLTAEFHKHFSNELTPVLLDVYDSWGKLDTMGVTSRTGIISAMYKIWYRWYCKL